MKNTLYIFNSKFLGKAFMEELLKIGYKIDDGWGFDGYRVEEPCKPLSIYYSYEENRLSVHNHQSINHSEYNFILETQWNQALEHAKNQLKKEEEFKVGDWIINDYILINIQEETKDGYNGFGFAVSGWTDYARWNTLKQTELRKATEKEIKNALIEEAKRRGLLCKKWKFNDPITKIEYNFVNDRLSENWIYKSIGDKLTNLSGIIYQNGKWATPIKEEFKFFEWDYEVDNTSYMFSMVKIGCLERTLEYFCDLYDDLSHVKDKTVQEVLDELEPIVNTQVKK